MNKGENIKLIKESRANHQTDSASTDIPNLKDLNSPELVFGMCGPIGSPIHEVADKIKKALEDDYNYDVKIIKLSSFIKNLIKQEERAQLVNISEKSSNKFRDKKELIAAGNKLREDYHNSVLVDLAIHHIALSRPENNETKPRRKCYIIDSVKNYEELKQLRSTYSEIFYFIGCFSPLDKRITRLARDMTQSELHQLIDQDSGEELDYGQTVRSIFPESDYFIRIDATTDTMIKAKVKRLLHVLFHTKLVTPTKDETAMYQAASAAGNSACLSRQVGAAITDSNGEVISIGWNDVPKFGGSVYRTSHDSDSNSEAKDYRCWNMEEGTCFNDKEKDLLAYLVVSRLEEGNILPKEKREEALRVVRSSEKLGNLLEFSRSIHAEMHAIISAGHINGEKIKNGILYVTTYPCHSCARHIIASGIKDVYFIEPYRKSLATKLHGDAITESENDINKVRIMMYEGVSPRRYLALFRIPTGKDRKEKGKMKLMDCKNATPVISTTLESIPVLESLTVHKLRQLHLVD